MSKFNRRTQPVNAGIFKKVKYQILTKPWIINAILFAAATSALIHIIMTNIVFVGKA
jgi:hypothetical protein